MNLHLLAWIVVAIGAVGACCVFAVLAIELREVWRERRQSWRGIARH